jgi:hypothetical protein
LKKETGFQRRQELRKAELLRPYHKKVNPQLILYFHVFTPHEILSF